LAESEGELPLITMLLDDSYQQALHAPVLLPGEEKPVQQQQKPSGSGNRRRPRRR
jgi:hypothetical protein